MYPEKSDTTLQAIDYAKIMEIETKDSDFNNYLNSKVEPKHFHSFRTGKSAVAPILRHL